MKDTTVAGRYARALIIVTEKRGETVQALEDMKGMGTLLEPGSQIARLLATPQVLLSDKRKVLLSVLEGKVLRSVALFADLLLRKKRLDEFPIVIEEFEALVEKQQGIKRAQVVSAVALSQGEISRLHAELERTTGAKIKLTSTIEPELVGGALVRIGDHVVDRTVKSLLEAIEQQLMEVAV